MISVIIPTLDTPQVLDLCLKSAILGQDNHNEIIVVIDGNFETNQKVLEQYATNIKPVILKQNVGTCKATNIGVYNAKYNNILIVNDDNVFPKGWDTILSRLDLNTNVFAPNQIEPYNSMCKQFHIHDLGRTPEEFDLKAFWEYEKKARQDLIEYTGSTFPIYIKKMNYMRCGGFDSDYPGLSGMVADWDFFMKCEMNGLKMMRTYQCMFYHFVSVTQKAPDKIYKTQEAEKLCHMYFRFKWGQWAQYDPLNNSKFIEDL